MKNNPTFLGLVDDVKGATVSVVLDTKTQSGLIFINGHGYRIGQIGSFIRIPLGYDNLYGIVSQVGAGAIPENVRTEDVQGRRWMTVQIVGESHSKGDFERGVSQYPTVGDQVHIVTEDDLERIYGSKDTPNYVNIGSIASSESIPALINIDRLLTRHSAIVGSTGSGKSTTVSSILSSISDKNLYPSARIIVLDIHGEYAKALRDRATVFRVAPNETLGEQALHIPYWAMNYDELMSVTFGSLGDVERGALLERISDLKLSSITSYPKNGVTPFNLTVDTPVPFSIHKLWFDTHCLVNSTHTVAGGQTVATQAFVLDATGNPEQPGDPMGVIPPRYKPHTLASGGEKIYLSSSPLNIRRPLENLASKLRDPRFNFLFLPGKWTPDIDGKVEKDIDSLLSQWIGGDKSISILDLSGIPVSILTSLIGALLRIIYDAIFWARNLSEGGRERPLLIILEEAHSYLNQDTANNASMAVKRIVKEGRKYGIGAMIVSQRPSEVDSTILSQCGTMIAMRLSNSSDRSHVTGAVTDNLEGLLNMLPALRTGEAIVIGESVHLPMRVLIEAPPVEHRPDSIDPLVYDKDGPGGWNRNKEKSDYSEVVEVWRKQDPKSPRIV